MKKTLGLTLFCLLLIYTLAFSQYSNRILKGQDSSLNIYLNSKLKHIKIDTCFSGIYYISFSLSANGTLKNYNISATLPRQSADSIKNALAGLKDYWQKDFLEKARGRKVVLPVYLFMYSNCKYDVPKSNEDSSLNLNIESDLFKVISSTTISFLEADNFTNQEKVPYIECILLNPCFIGNEEPYMRRRRIL